MCLDNYGGFPGGSDGEISACNAGDPDSIPGSGRSPGEGNGNPLQYSCLENSICHGCGKWVQGDLPEGHWLIPVLLLFNNFTSKES